MVTSLSVSVGGKKESQQPWHLGFQQNWSSKNLFFVEIQIMKPVDLFYIALNGNYFAETQQNPSWFKLRSQGDGGPTYSSRWRTWAEICCADGLQWGRDRVHPFSSEQHNKLFSKSKKKYTTCGYTMILYVVKNCFHYVKWRIFKGRVKSIRCGKSGRLFL